MRACNVFDKYRDGELSPAERKTFELHLAVCEDCRTKMAILNKIVRILRQEEIRPLDQADKIARRAFTLGNSWDVLVVSWLRPGPALAALALVLVLFSFMWITPGSQPVNAYSEYQQLIDETEAVNLGMSVSQVRNDSELVLWLEREGHSQ